MNGPPRRGAHAAPTVVRDLERFVLHRVRLPMREPFVAAHATEIDREVVLVEAVGGDGIHGWGECVALSAPTYTTETTEGAWHVLRTSLVPAVLSGGGIRIADAPMAVASLFGALEDLELRRRGHSLADAVSRPELHDVVPAMDASGSAAPIGGPPRPTVACTAVVGRAASIDELLARVALRVAEGYGSIKLKIGPDWFLAPLRAVRERWPDVALAADANGTLDERDAAADLRALDALGLQYVEQPLAADALAALARLTERIATPIALDETIRGEQDLVRALGFGVRYVVNLKPGRVGGTVESIRIADRATRSNLSMFVGGMLETGVGRAYALAFASLAACDLPTDLGPSSRYFAADLTAPIELLPGGRLGVPRDPGIGVSPRPDRLAAATVDRVELLR